jgi:hypothetical protein
MGDGVTDSARLLDRLAVLPSVNYSVRWQEAPGSKVLKMLKVLKVLNFSGAVCSTIFEFTFIDTAAKGPDLAAPGCPLLGYGDVFGLRCRICIEVRVGACFLGEMPWSGHHQVVEREAAQRRSPSRLADERWGSGRHCRVLGKPGSDNQGLLALSGTEFSRGQPENQRSWSREWASLLKKASLATLGVAVSLNTQV